jgi:serine/threonine-protein kinase
VNQIGKYEVIRKIATGGMAEVFLGRAAGPMGFEKQVVLKRILPHLAEDAQFVEMFFSEARLAAQLNHPNIVQVYDFGETTGAYYIAMEYVDGPNLRLALDSATRVGKAPSLAMCARLVAQACEGLAYAHEFKDPASGQPLNLIHRDVGLDNLLVALTGTVKVVDFGVAKAQTQGHRTQNGVIKGKVMYMPPEQLLGQTLDCRVDVYALGVVLYELVTGVSPFVGASDIALIQAVLQQPLPPVQQRRPDCPENLVRIINRALERKAEGRYPSCRELQEDLEEFIITSGEKVSISKVGRWLGEVNVASGGQPTGKTPVASGVNAGTFVLKSGERAAAEAPLEGTLMRPASQARPSVPPAEVAPAPQPVAPSPEAVASPAAPAAGSSPPAAPAAVSAPAPGPVPNDGRRSTPPGPRRTGPRAPPPRAAARPTGLIIGGVVAGVLALGAAAMFGLKSGARAPAEKLDRAPAATTVAAAAAQPTPPPTPAAAPAPAAAQATPPPAPAAPVPAAPPVPAPAAASASGSPGTLVVRVGPWADVYLDGKHLGKTPFDPLVVPSGTHTIRLINDELKKDITLPLEIQPGVQNLFKHRM